MNRSMVMILGFLLCACLIHPGQAQDQENEEAMTLARKLTEEGAKTFNTADAKAMAAYYVEDARMYLQSKENDEDSEKEYSGRAEIEKFYADIFKNPGTIQAKNTVDYARRLGPDILVIAGTFVPNEAADKPLKVPFYQVRVKRGDRWLIHRLRIFVLPEKK
ncbi:MAG: SgcJ/EcaC family oxidoreductase [Isosphaeraceae bacterium]